MLRLSYEFRGSSFMAIDKHDGIFKKISNQWFYAIAFSFFIFSVISFDVGPLNVKVFDLVFVLLAIFCLLYFFFYQKNVFSKINLNLPAFLLLLHLLVLSIYPLFGVLKGVLDLSVSLRWFEMFVFVIIFIILINPSRILVISVFGRALLIAGILNLIYGLLMLLEFIGIVNFILPHHYLADVFNWKVDHYIRVPALFSGPNQLGWYAVLVAILSIGVLLERSQLVNKKLWSIVLLIHFFLLIISTARTAIMAFFAVAIFFYFITFVRSMFFGFINKKLIQILILLLALSALTFVVGNYFNVFRLSGLERAFLVFFEGSSSDGSFSKRLDLWNHALNIYFNDHYPFGTIITPTLYTGTIDSGWISYFVQSGVLYVLTFSLFIFSSIIYGVVKYFKRNDFISLSLACAAIAIAIGQVTVSPFHYLSTFFVFLIILITSNIKQNNAY
jgi:hypothetical protein